MIHEMAPTDKSERTRALCQGQMLSPELVGVCRNTEPAIQDLSHMHSPGETGAASIDSRIIPWKQWGQHECNRGSAVANITTISDQVRPECSGDDDAPPVHLNARHTPKRMTKKRLNRGAGNCTICKISFESGQQELFEHLYRHLEE